jgi:hypothetical protein
MVTWEMPDGTEFEYLGSLITNQVLREFVLRFMGADGMSLDAAQWDLGQLEAAFERRFGERVKVRRERKPGGFRDESLLIFRPVPSGI